MDNLNNLYNAYTASKKNSSWKSEVQKYEMNWLTELVALQHELQDHTYYTREGTTFTLNERGKIRNIVGNRMRDRVVRHSFCDNVLAPSVSKYLIYDNGASIKGKGITFSRNRLLKHLRNYYHNYGNDGYVLLIDFSKYYDNIRHDRVYELVADKIDPKYMWLFNVIMDNFKVDVSYMSEEEYSKCMDTKYDSIQSPFSNKGEKYMYKSVNIGDQSSQIIGVYFPTPLDNCAKIFCSQKYYGRYMDDSYILSPSKECLKDILNKLITIANYLGIHINTRKTHIFKLSRGFRYLQCWYQLTESGRVIIKINPKRLVAMRRKLKGFAGKVILGCRDRESFEQLYRSWFKNYYRIMSRKQRDNLENLYFSLVKEFDNYGIQNYSSRQNRNPLYIEW